MNDARRKSLREVRDKLEEVKDRLSNLASEERDAFENIPENMQQSERASEAERAADTMDDTVGELESAISNIEGLI